MVVVEIRTGLRCCCLWLCRYGVNGLVMMMMDVLSTVR